MLIRRWSNPANTVRIDRQSWPQYFINKEWVRLDPWEDDDCLECIARLYSVGVEHLKPDEWNRVTVHGFHVADEQQPVRLLEDPETSYIYYRRPIDIERAEKWRHDRSFRVTASEW